MCHSLFYTWSILTENQGNITFNLNSGSLNMGYVNIDNATLSPGNNTFPIYGYLDLPIVLKNIAEVLTDQKEYISKGDLLISVTGNKTMYNGQHLPYYEEVFKHVNLTTALPVSRILKGTLGGVEGDNGQGSFKDLLKQMNLNLTGLSGLSGLSSLSNS